MSTQDGVIMRFSVQRSPESGQPFFFEIQAPGNYETLATSEMYASKRDALDAVELIQRYAGEAEVVDNS